MRESKQQQILFFVNGAVPTAADYAAAEALGTKTFRNARKSSLPPKDGCRCAGCVPPAYLKAKNVTVVQPQLQQAKPNNK